MGCCVPSREGVDGLFGECGGCLLSGMPCDNAFRVVEWYMGP